MAIRHISGEDFHLNCSLIKSSKENNFADVLPDSLNELLWIELVDLDIFCLHFLIQPIPTLQFNFIYQMRQYTVPAALAKHSDMDPSVFFQFTCLNYH